MSSAREIAGTKARAGRKAAHVGRWTKADEESLRRAFHDFERRNGRRVRRAAKPQWGQHAGSRGKRQRLSPSSWHTRFVAALARTGDMKSAARMAGVPHGTARNALRSDKVALLSLRAQARTAQGEHLLRMLEQVAKGQVKRWRVGPRKARAILAMVKGGAA